MRKKIKCGARTRRGTPCQCKAIRTKRGAMRCRLHGGLSTGPRTAEGRARISEAIHRQLDSAKETPSNQKVNFNSRDFRNDSC
jgi:hypothetical protein